MGRYEFPKPDSPTAKLRIAHHVVTCGGQTATTLCTCAAMGLRARYVGATGNDDNGRLIRDELSRRGVDITHTAVRDAANGYAVSVPCVDLTDRFRHSVRQGRLTHPPNDTHWSAEGHAIAAAAVHDVLRERGWLMSCNAKTEQWPFARIAKSTAKQVRH